MAFLGLCPDDRLLKTLRDTLRAHPLRVPETGVQPLHVIAARTGRVAKRGELIPLLAGSGTSLPAPKTSNLPDLSSRRTQAVRKGLGLKILDGFLSGFGIATPAVSAALEGAEALSFSFSDVRRKWVDVNWLGRALAGLVIDLRNPAARIFVTGWGCFVIDSVISSSDFSVWDESNKSAGGQLDLSIVEDVVARGEAGVQVQSSSGSDLTFKGPKQLTFAFTCIRLKLGDDGTILQLEPTEGPNPTFGFDAARGEYGDMVKRGVVDSAKVTRSALQNAASIAGLFLTTEVTVVEEQAEEQARERALPMSEGDVPPIGLGEDQ